MTAYSTEVFMGPRTPVGKVMLNFVRTCFHGSHVESIQSRGLETTHFGNRLNSLYLRRKSNRASSSKLFLYGLWLGKKIKKPSTLFWKSILNMLHIDEDTSL